MEPGHQKALFDGGPSGEETRLDTKHFLDERPSKQTCPRGQKEPPPATSKALSTYLHFDNSLSSTDILS
jgi:hypothetical protein